MNQRGFTLIEIVVVMSIFGVVMMASYTILTSTLEADRRIQQTTMSSKIGEAILNQMRRDLQGVVWRGLGQDIFRGEDRGDEDDAEDVIDFLTTSPVPPPEDEVSSWTDEVSSVGYALRPGEENGDFVLFRRVEWDLATDPLDQGSRTALYDRVKALDIHYLGEEGEWVREWDSSDLLPEQNLTDFPFLDEREELAESEEEEGDSETVPQPGEVDPSTGELIPEEPLPRPLPRAVQIVLYLHYGNEQGRILDANQEPMVEQFSTIVGLLVSDQILVEDPAALLEEGLGN
ncbi:MAG: prepilin-type N-terminal cleavage/methylation domain-containing protein [Planctomycetota bacterium]|nr:prepilin-type N-terminal cleavage/methylation domain-containing protein [Planctomycetota bacterium]